MTVPNSRNGIATQTPIFMTDMSGVYQYGALVRADYGVTIWRRTIATDSYTTYDLEGAAAAKVTPANYQPEGRYLTPIATYDDHWGISVGVDSQNRIHLFGNSHARAMHYIRSAAADITSWSDVATNFTLYQTMPWARDSNALHNAHTYNFQARLSDGTLLHLFDRDPSTTNSRGRVTLLHYLPAGAGTTWLPHGGSTASGALNGQLSQSSSSAIFGVEADRAYAQNLRVDANDRIHVAGNWRVQDEDGNYATRPWYIYTDDITADAWKNALGVAQPTPLTWANTAGALNQTTIQSAPGYMWGGLAGGLGLDENGFPHVCMPNGNALGEGALAGFTPYTSGGYVRCFWDGSAWDVTGILNPQYLPTVTSLGTGAGNVIYTIESRLFSGQRRTRISNNGGSAGRSFFYMGGAHPTAWSPQPDPVKLAETVTGQLDLFIPDGDTPLVWSFGNHTRVMTTGDLLHSDTETTSDSSTAWDASSSSPDGGWGMLRVTAYSGFTSVAFKLEHSTDNSSWVDLSTFATVTGTGGQHVHIPGTVRRYVRVTWTKTGTGSVTFGCWFLRL